MEDYEVKKVLIMIFDRMKKIDMIDDVAYGKLLYLLYKEIDIDNFYINPYYDFTEEYIQNLQSLL